MIYYALRDQLTRAHQKSDRWDSGLLPLGSDGKVAKGLSDDGGAGVLGAAGALADGESNL